MAGRDSSNSGGDIEVLYVTERIIVLTFPFGGHDSSYRQSLKEVSSMLKTKHADRYKVSVKI